LPTFEELFGTPPSVRTEAPGRVNLMGDHTDYNGGFVLPSAIPQKTSVELAASAGDGVRVWSAAYPNDQPVEYRLGQERRDGFWTDYVKGMTVVLAPLGLRNGFDARIASDVPVGSGLSSSAALEISLGRAIRQAFGLAVSDIELARAGRRAENDFVGAPVGIMDQMACSLATPATALFLDTRSLEFEEVPIPAAAAVLVIDSGVEHRHAAGGYKERRRECDEAAALLGVEQLRDVDATSTAWTRLPDPLNRRVRHVLSENQRVLDTVSAFRAGDLRKAGALFSASHASLRDDFEVSVPEIDRLIEIAGTVQGVYGVRLTGGGFGGAVVALCAAGRARPAGDAVVERYTRATRCNATRVVPA
jgi:galactokinase